MKKVELLAPSGDLERLKIAFLYGADAVYFGGKKFSLRANAVNFSMDDIKKAYEIKTKLNKKIYLTLNIFFHDDEMDEVYDYIKEVAPYVDGFIVSDISLIKYIKENTNCEVHISTQLSVANYMSAMFLKEEGVGRIVLARELTPSEIKEIHENTNLDLEVFIHGATCSMYSGRCVLSSYFTGRDPNRGGCAQVCRFLFNGVNFAAKDLNGSYHIKNLIDAGVRSFKIEGRMRSLYYIAIVVGAYREMIDKIYNDSLDEYTLNILEDDLTRVSNRENSPQALKGFLNEDDFYIQEERSEPTNQEFVALVEKQVDNILYIEQRNYFKVGDELEIITPSRNRLKFTVDNLFNELDEEVEVARHPKEKLYMKIKLPFTVEESSMIRRVI